MTNFLRLLSVPTSLVEASKASYITVSSLDLIQYFRDLKSHWLRVDRSWFYYSYFLFSAYHPALLASGSPAISFPLRLPKQAVLFMTPSMLVTTGSKQVANANHSSKLIVLRLFDSSNTGCHSYGIVVTWVRIMLNAKSV